MNRIVLGAFAALLLVASGVFWWQGRAQTARNAPPPSIAATDGAQPDAEDPPDEDGAGQHGASLPQASEESREARRFDRFDKDRDGRITRNELLAPRVKAFRKLDVDGNNLLSFEEWAVRTSNKFKGADHNGDGALTREEFVATKSKKSAAKCQCKPAAGSHRGRSKGGRAARDQSGSDPASGNDGGEPDG
ncbi:EF-hand domain-containing protein [Novosphingobium lentum]|uniref:EF-hand domain-containing protein n=1 Tax=Novosphingobium lentum TaxID=145287 RepID=UPI000A06FF3A